MTLYPIHRSRFALFRTVIAPAFFAFLGACTLLQPGEPRIVANGDIHGDYGAFEQVITRAGLMDDGG